jgi:transcriptional regulator with XRE-family HTH domain
MTFDPALFCSALDAERHRQRMTWNQVADEAGVSASTLTRINQGRHPNIDGFLALCHWSGINPSVFVPRNGDPSLAVELALLLARHDVPRACRPPLVELVTEMARR